MRSGELGQLEIMRGKQGEGLRLVVQLTSNRAGQGQAVEGGGAAPDFGHPPQGLPRGTVQYLPGPDHLQHKGGLRIGQVGGCAYAGVDGVHRPQAAGLGRHIRAHGGQQHNKCYLPHIRRFTAHVRPGDDLHALAWA